MRKLTILLAVVVLAGCSSGAFRNSVGRKAAISRSTFAGLVPTRTRRGPSLKSSSPSHPT